MRSLLAPQWLRSSATVASSSRLFTTTARSATKHERTESPARSHRRGLKGGAEHDPLTEEPRNASSQFKAETAEEKQQTISDFASGFAGPGAEMGRAGKEQVAGGSGDVSTQEAKDSVLSSLEAGVLSSQASTSAATTSPPPSVPTFPLGGLGYTSTTLPPKSDELLEAFVGYLQRDGKKALATRQVLNMLSHLSQALNSDPLPALRHAVELASPVVKMQSQTARVKTVMVPTALNPRQQRRRGIMAIIQASGKRNDREIDRRLAREVIAILEGSSETLKRKDEVHRDAVRNRANLDVRM